MLPRSIIAVKEASFLGFEGSDAALRFSTDIGGAVDVPVAEGEEQQQQWEEERRRRRRQAMATVASTAFCSVHQCPDRTRETATVALTIDWWLTNAATRPPSPMDPSSPASFWNTRTCFASARFQGFLGGIFQLLRNDFFSLREANATIFSLHEQFAGKSNEQTTYY